MLINHIFEFLQMAFNNSLPKFLIWSLKALQNTYLFYFFKNRLTHKNVANKKLQDLVLVLCLQLLLWCLHHQVH